MLNITETNTYKTSFQDYEGPKGDWSKWVITGDRGSGKTEIAKKHVKELIYSEKYKNILIVSRMSKDSLYETSQMKCFNTVFPSVKIDFMIYQNDDSFDSHRGKQYDLIWMDNSEDMGFDLYYHYLMRQLCLGDNPKMIISGETNEIEQSLGTIHTHFQLEPDTTKELEKEIAEFIKDKYLGMKFLEQTLRSISKDLSNIIKLNETRKNG